MPSKTTTKTPGVKIERFFKARRQELVITRIFDAPRELVWKAWTDPERVKRWWGPKGFTAPFCKIDLRVGGVFHYCMRSPDGKDYWNTGVYREIVPLEGIICTNSFANEKGNVVPATYYGMSPDFPPEMQLTMTFEEHGGKTKMTLRHVGLPVGEMSEQTETGWNESFDKLAESVKQSTKEEIIMRDAKNSLKLTLPTDREIVFTRVFDAPRERVFKAYTDPNRIPEWWGPKGFTTTVDKMDVRPGGAWRFVQQGPDGQEHAFRGVYREIPAPERLVHTFEWEGMPGHVLIETITFEERLGGKTKVTVTALFHTAEERDGMFQSGMEAGARESMDRLEEHLRKEN